MQRGVFLEEALVIYKTFRRADVGHNVLILNHPMNVGFIVGVVVGDAEEPNQG